MQNGYVKNQGYYGVIAGKNASQPTLPLGGGRCDHGGLDELIGKKVCSDQYTYYIGPCYAVGTSYVHTLCTDAELNTCNQYLVKLVDLRSWIKADDVDAEYSYTQRASDLGVAPRLLGLDFCTYNNVPYALVIMQKYGDGTLTQLVAHHRPYFDAHRESICAELRGMIEALNAHNIDHGDIHSDNFLYRWKEDQSIEFKMIDFGTAAPFKGKDRSNYIVEMLAPVEGSLNLRTCVLKVAA